MVIGMIDKSSHLRCAVWGFILLTYTYIHNSVKVYSSSLRALEKGFLVSAGKTQEPHTVSGPQWVKVRDFALTALVSGCCTLALMLLMRVQSSTLSYSIGGFWLEKRKYGVVATMPGCEKMCTLQSQ